MIENDVLSVCILSEEGPITNEFVAGHLFGHLEPDIEIDNRFWATVGSDQECVRCYSLGKVVGQPTYRPRAPMRDRCQNYRKRKTRT